MPGADPEEGLSFPRLEWDEEFRFPPPQDADERGLLAVGGNLSPGMLLSAYRQGIFPWFSEEGVPYWFTPDPRFVLIPSELHVSESLRKVLKKRPFRVTYDQAFPQVMAGCAEAPRPGQDGTWITPDYHQGYGELHRLGFAHSVEVWDRGEPPRLVGGLYGIHLGRVFFGESMFSRVSNASKVGFVSLVESLTRRGTKLIDCQAPTAYLASFGAKPVPRAWFLSQLFEILEFPGVRGPWDFSED